MDGEIQEISPHAGTTSSPSPAPFLPHRCPPALVPMGLLPWQSGAMAALAEAPLGSGCKPSAGIFKSSGQGLGA